MTSPNLHTRFVSSSAEPPLGVMVEELAQDVLHRGKSRVREEAGLSISMWPRWPRVPRQPEYPAVSELNPLAVEGLFGFLSQQVADLLEKVDALTRHIANIEDALAERPQERLVSLVNLGSTRIALREPIFVNVEEYDDETLARWPAVGLTSTGAGEPEALEALSSEILMLYDELNLSPADELGQTPRRWLETLRRTLSEK